MKKIFVLLILFQAGIIAQQGQWDVIGTMPWPVAGADAFTDNINIYIVGGYSDSTQGNVNWIVKYNTTLQLWKHLTHLNFDRIGLLTSRTQDSVYILGGIIDTSDNTQSLESWGFSDAPVITNYNIQFDRTNATGLIADNNNFFIIGGNPSLNGTGNLPYIVQYNVTSRSIVYSSDTLFIGGVLPEQQMSILDGNDILIMGGVMNGISQKIYKFNTLSYAFNILPISLTVPRAAGRVVKFEETGDIYIIGGYNEQETALNSVEILRKTGGDYKIEQGPPLNFARRDFIAAYIEGAIYVMGGYNEVDEIVPQIEKLSFNTTGAFLNPPEKIEDFHLEQNYPNPFNPSTKISFSVKKRSLLSIDIYNIQGKLIRKLNKGEYSKGRYTIVWDGKDNNEMSVPTGVYLYKLSSNQYKDVKKMVLLK